jgi:hypothetical protein
MVSHRGGSAIHSTPIEDQFEHVDYHVYNILGAGDWSKDYKGIQVDVKSRPNFIIDVSHLTDRQRKLYQCQGEYDDFTNLEVVGRCALGDNQGRIFGSSSLYLAQERRWGFDIYTIEGIKVFLQHPRLQQALAKTAKDRDDEPLGYKPYQIYSRKDEQDRHSGHFLYVPTVLLNFFMQQRNQLIKWKEK